MEKILILDNDRKSISKLQRALLFEGYEVLHTDSGDVGINIARNWRPNLVVLNLLMTSLDGWKVCQHLRNDSNVPMITMSESDDVGIRVRALDLGADDYLMKPFALEELLARIRALLRRRDTNKSVVVFANLVLKSVSREVYRGSRSIDLTAKEYDILALFMKHPNTVISKELMYSKIWGSETNTDSNVLAVFIATLRQKLEHSNESRLIHTVRKIGYMLME